MFKKLYSLLLAGVLLFSISACNGVAIGGSQNTSSEPVDPNFPVSIGDIRVMQRPERVVSLSPALTEMICELGAQDRLQGVSNFCDYPKAVTALTQCGTAALPEMSAIKDISPQVVFTSAALSQEHTIKLQQMGAEVIVAPPAQSLEELKVLYETIGMVLDGMEDGKANAQSLLDTYQKKYDALTAAAGQVTEKVSAVYLCSEPLIMATGDTFVGQMMEAVGIENAAGAFTGWEYPEDEAVNLYPDAIFYGEPVQESFLRESKVYNTTDAVKNEMIFAIDNTAFERQSGRMFDELANMFRALYPDIPLTDSPVADTQTAPDSDTNEEQASQDSGKEAPEEEDMYDLDDFTKVNG